MPIATFIRQLPDMQFGACQKLWRCEPPMKCGGKDLSFDVNKAREEMLAEIDEVLQESGHWVGGRLDTIKKLCGVK